MTQAESHPADETSGPTDAPAAAVTDTRLPRRRWLQFRLRTLMSMIFLLSVVLAILAWRIQRGREQATTVATIRQLGGYINYDYNFSRDAAGRLVAGKGDSPVPLTLRRALGEDFFHTVRGVTAPYGPPKSAGEPREFWNAVDRLPRLQLIDAHDGWIQPRRTPQVLQTKSELYYLNLRWATLTDNDVAFIAGLKQLRAVDLSGSRVSDRGVSKLIGLPHLEMANLRGTAISSAGIEAFQREYPASILLHD